MCLPGDTRARATTNKMTSLYPGLLFYSVGLNKKSTPVKPETTPSEIDRRLGRAAFNGRPWPRPSPVSSVYDVRNSSTRMIILNNKLSRKPKGSRLRGQTTNSGEIVLPEPERHLSDMKPHTNWEHHKQCSLSVSEKFVPIFPQGVTPTPAWVNQTQRPAMKFDNGSGVNPNHHIQCQGHMDYDIVRWYNAHAHRRVGGAHSRPTSRADGTSGSRALSPILNDPSLTRGERRYLNSIAKIYSVDNMRQQKQVQYNNLMWKEVSKGGYKEGEWEKYQRYLNTPRKTQFGPCDPFREKRASSVPGLNKAAREDARPHTSQTGQRSAIPSSRSTSTAPARSNRPYRPNTKGKTQKASKLKGSESSRPQARNESPLPPPKCRKSSVSSLSSLGEEDGANVADRKTEETSDKREVAKTSPQSPRQGDGDQKTQQVDDTSPRATTTIAVEEEEQRKLSDEEADDERSKMSARDPAVSDEQRGAHLEYRPTYGEREGEQERVGHGETSDRRVQDPPSGSARETYTHAGQPQSVAQVKSRSPQTSPKERTAIGEEKSAKKDETGRDELSEQGHRPDSSKSLPVTSNASEKDDVEEVVRLAKSPESSTDVFKKENLRVDSAVSRGSERIHKEGKDRPLSRLGGREQFMVVKKGKN
ncbi:hypothetical protein PoB_005614400 [Plakobranchus ocellatus]|uniref:Nuclear protein MDM1 n=1 Tax=Plakobranchus ocellatus TaxID=259542 RepID=A0AAV4CFT0_9GAST|nr:hypothetical protein PoB_005614400 [Plakobranchus ocellatus]